MEKICLKLFCQFSFLHVHFNPRTLENMSIFIQIVYSQVKKPIWTLATFFRLRIEIGENFQTGQWEKIEHSYRKLWKNSLADRDQINYLWLAQIGNFFFNFKHIFQIFNPRGKKTFYNYSKICNFSFQKVLDRHRRVKSEYKALIFGVVVVVVFVLIFFQRYCILNYQKFFLIDKYIFLWTYLS